jgi:predicted nicotinamide N-methyase
MIVPHGEDVMRASDLVYKAGRARHKVARARRAFGLPGVALAVLGQIHRAAVLATRLASRPFLHLGELATDAWLGVDTRTKVDDESAIKELACGGDPEEYEPVNLLWWMRVMSAVPLDPSRTTFVDLGAGRGRALILAARMGFHRVIGVELDEQLASDAESNIARWSGRRGARRQGQEICVVRTDAADFAWPHGSLLVSLFNPFGAQTLRRVLARAGTQPPTAGDEVYIAYFNPVQQHVFDEFPRFVLQDHGVDWVLYRLNVAARTA